jgi:hypothetical protein
MHCPARVSRPAVIIKVHSMLCKASSSIPAPPAASCTAVTAVCCCAVPQAGAHHGCQGMLHSVCIRSSMLSPVYCEVSHLRSQATTHTAVNLAVGHRARPATQHLHKLQSQDTSSSAPAYPWRHPAPTRRHAGCFACSERFPRNSDPVCPSTVHAAAAAAAAVAVSCLQEARGFLL